MPSKRTCAFQEKVQPGKTYPATEAIALIKTCANAKFNETVDISIVLGIDTAKSDQAIRGALILPHGTGRQVRVAVFTQGAQADAARAAGADKVGFEDLAESMKKGELNYDVVIASPDAMRIVGQLGQILGPRGLMPNPKVGTVSADVAAAVRNAKGGQVRYRSDKAGIVHAILGKADFAPEHLQANLKAFIQDVKRAKPATVKGVFIKKIVISSTMGPGIAIDLSTLN